MKRMLYQMILPDIAAGPGPIPLGSIAGRGTMVPAVDCPNPRNGTRSPLAACLDCTHLGEVGLHHIECAYVQTPQEMAEIQRRMGQPGPAPGQQPGPQAVPHPGVQPPVPPNVYEPTKK